MTTKVDLGNVSASALLDELSARLDAGDNLPAGIRIRHSDVIDYAWEIGGVYSGENTTAAAGAISELVRYLNHATQRQSALPYLSTADSMLGSLSEAASRMVQLLDQVARLMGSERHRRSVYDARDKGNAELAAATLRGWREVVQRAASYAGQLAAALDRDTKHPQLGNDSTHTSAMGNLTDADDRLIVDREGNPV